MFFSLSAPLVKNDAYCMPKKRLMRFGFCESLFFQLLHLCTYLLIIGMPVAFTVAVISMKSAQPHTSYVYISVPFVVSLSFTLVLDPRTYTSHNSIRCHW